MEHLGFLFKPSDQLLLQFLREKLQGRPHSCGDSIQEDKVYDCHPQIIIDRRATGADRSSCYVFTTTKRRSGSRPVRTMNGSTTAGKWHATKGERPVYGCNNQVVLGHKISLAYYDGDGRKTQWLMDEYFIKEFREQRQQHCRASSTTGGGDGSRLKRKRGGGGGGEEEVLDRWVVCYLHPSPRKGPWSTTQKYAAHVQDQDGQVPMISSSTHDTANGRDHPAMMVSSDNTINHIITSPVSCLAPPNSDDHLEPWSYYTLDALEECKLLDDQDPPAAAAAALESWTLDAFEEWLLEDQDPAAAAALECWTLDAFEEWLLEEDPPAGQLELPPTSSSSAAAEDAAALLLMEQPSSTDVLIDAPCSSSTTVPAVLQLAAPDIVSDRRENSCWSQFLGGESLEGTISDLFRAETQAEYYYCSEADHRGGPWFDMIYIPEEAWRLQQSSSSTGATTFEGGQGQHEHMRSAGGCTCCC